jgi:hypothetical protein
MGGRLTALPSGALRVNIYRNQLVQDLHHNNTMQPTRSLLYNRTYLSILSVTSVVQDYMHTLITNSSRYRHDFFPVSLLVLSTKLHNVPCHWKIFFLSLSLSNEMKGYFPYFFYYLWMLFFVIYSLFQNNCILRVSVIIFVKHGPQIPGSFYTLNKRQRKATSGSVRFLWA